jgi:hypothetical protein
MSYHPSLTSGVSLQQKGESYEEEAETMPNRDGMKVLRLHKETIRLFEERTDLLNVVGGTSLPSHCDSLTGRGCCYQK